MTTQVVISSEELPIKQKKSKGKHDKEKRGKTKDSKEKKLKRKDGHVKAEQEQLNNSEGEHNEEKSRAERSSSTSSDLPISPPKKRKRPEVEEDDELEIDLSLPEPLSKKALRQAKKAKNESKESLGAKDTSAQSNNAEASQKTTQRTQYGIWIGNLPWSATKAGLRVFFTERAGISDDKIARVHMPRPKADQASKQRVQPQNRGFAYVDFTTAEAMQAASALNEHEFFGRNVLIKDAKNFEGRPEAPKTENNNAASTKPPSKRIFVGNLGFDVTKEDLLEHFGKCGEVADAFMATFEDSGKSKGFAWVTFSELESAQAAVRGYVMEEDDEDEDEGGKPKRPRKTFVTRLQGRDLRCEFAEDATTRYNKRYGKEKPSREESRGWAEEVSNGDDDGRGKKSAGKPVFAKGKQRSGKEFVPRGPKKASVGIVEAQGKKTTFD